MFRSIFRITVAAVFVFALVFSTIPAQAQPGDLGASIDADSSWLDVAFGWIQSLLGGDREALQSETTKNKIPAGPAATGPCIDPYGIGCLEVP